MLGLFTFAVLQPTTSLGDQVLRFLRASPEKTGTIELGGDYRQTGSGIEIADPQDSFARGDTFAYVAYLPESVGII